MKGFIPKETVNLVKPCVISVHNYNLRALEPVVGWLTTLTSDLASLNFDKFQGGGRDIQINKQSWRGRNKLW